MNPFETFRDKNLAEKRTASITKHAHGLEDVNLMEVCGTHTMNIHRFGVKQLLPSNVNLLSGPGCPVCVTPSIAIDEACAIAQMDNVIITNFGDMVRVPGSTSYLKKERAKGAARVIFYSPLYALGLAKKKPDHIVIFIGVGFETTIPAVALTVKKAKEEAVTNFFILVLHKLIPPAMEALLKSDEVKIHGFIAPAHVSAVIGAYPYEFIIERYGIPCVIAGFEPIDILYGIDLILKQIKNRAPLVGIEYNRVVRREGNKNAQAVIDEIYEPCDSEWRGIGSIPASGLKLKKQYREYDALDKFKVSVAAAEDNHSWLCGSVLRGFKNPLDCKLFGKSCTPANQQGACMVPSVGTCAA